MCKHSTYTKIFKLVQEVNEKTNYKIDIKYYSTDNELDLFIFEPDWSFGPASRIIRCTEVNGKMIMLSQIKYMENLLNGILKCSR